jgi:dipeptidyl aminopeptidase/acylaminoacyl peptidase
LGVFLDEAKRNEKDITAFLFTYDVKGFKTTGFIITPKKIDESMPVIIFNRGGTGDFGLIPHGQYFTKIATMAKWGYIIIGSYYPGNSFSEGKDERGGESDILSVTKLYNLISYLDNTDENNIAMYGESRGGMMTYLCMQYVPWIKAAVTVGGLTNLKRSLEDRPEMEQIFEDSFGNTKDGIIARSAVKWTDRLNTSTPLCLIHGGADEVVNPLDALEMATNLQKNNHPYSLHIIQNANHGLTNFTEDRNRYAREWFKKYLKHTEIK